MGGGFVCCNLEAVGPGSYTVRLDHGDEDGDVSQWTAISASYTDPQCISWALWGNTHTHLMKPHSQEKLSKSLSW